MSARRAPILLRAAAAAAICGISLLLWCCSKPPGVRAVVLITMESIGARDASAGHNALATTDFTPPEGGTALAPPLPEDIDDLATLGVRFTNAFAPSGSAFASLAGLHTGRAPEDSGVYSDTDKLEGAVTLAESLASRGVRAGAFVARESLTAAAGLARGFSSYTNYPRGADFTADAKVWIDAERFLNPGGIFLWVHLSSARPPFEPRDEFRERLAPGVDPEFGSLASLAAYASDPAKRTLAARRAAAGLHSAAILQDASVVRKLLLAIRPSLDDFKNTLLVFAGTNGELAGELGLFGSRRALRDATLRVPVYVWKRGVFSLPRVASPVVGLADVTATIAAAFGAPLAADARGEDLFAILESKDSAKRAAFAAWENQIFTIRTARERYVCNPLAIAPGGWPATRADSTPQIPRVHEELFDVRDDPNERNNLAASAPVRAESMALLLERARAALRPKPPRPETDPRRLGLLAAEGIHAGDTHPTGPPAPGCGSVR